MVPSIFLDKYYHLRENETNKTVYKMESECLICKLLVISLG